MKQCLEISAPRVPLFITRGRDADGLETVLNIHQAGRGDRLNYRMVYGIARAAAVDDAIANPDLTVSVEVAATYEGY